ncbi:hypothetical protein AB0J14_28520 [Micromonospora arborensis]|uniref:hypothetical protein n=1 Tax=Micromonospora arborensis TaxID=2116518 RepID=UPI0033CAD206
MQRRIQTGHRQRHPGPRHPGVSQQVDRGQRSLIPDQLLLDVILYIGHRMREKANMQGIAALPADVIPNLPEQVACSLTLTL